MSKVILTTDQAKAMLAPGEYVHAFKSPDYNVLIGADWERARIEAEIDKSVCELAGPVATSMGHELCINTANGPLFVETAKISDEKVLTNAKR